MDYDKMTIKSLANDCFEDSFYKINAADLESRIQYLCDKYHQDKLDNLSQHLVSNLLNFDIEVGDRVLFKKTDTTVTEIIEDGRFSGMIRVKTEKGSSVAKRNEVILMHRKI